MGILPERVDTDDFWRADVVSVSYAALAAYLKDSRLTLAETLMDAGVFSQAARSALRSLRARGSKAADDAADEIDRLLADTDLLERYRMSLLET